MRLPDAEPIRRQAAVKTGAAVAVEKEPVKHFRDLFLFGVDGEPFDLSGLTDLQDNADGCGLDVEIDGGALCAADAFGKLSGIGQYNVIFGGAGVANIRSVKGETVLVDLHFE